MLYSELRVKGDGIRRARWVNCLMFLPLLLCVVIPNSLKLAAALSLAAAGLFAATRLKFDRDSQRVLAMFLVSVAVTSFYLFVGVLNNAPVEAVLQVVVVYIVSPLLWLFSLFYLFRRVGGDDVANALGILSIFCCVSVVIFVAAYQLFGREAVSFFIAEDKANVQWGKGYAGATMHVFGSMIFLTGAVLAAPSVIRGRLLRYSSIIALVCVAVLSGRSALMFSVFLGVALGVLIRSLAGAVPRRRDLLRSFLFVPLTLVAIVLPAYLIDAFTEFDLALALSDLWLKIKLGGGDERTAQFSELIQGAASNYFLGAGHGVGVDFARSDDFPWRYELVWLATIFRVGVIGFVLYSLVFLFYLIRMTRKFAAKSYSDSDLFFFSGFICALVASFTNPYIEAFTFQWMFVVPLVAEFGSGLQQRSRLNRRVVG